MKARGSFTAGGGDADRLCEPTSAGATGTGAFFAAGFLASCAFISGWAFSGAAFLVAFLTTGCLADGALAVAAFFGAASFLAGEAFFLVGALAAFRCVAGSRASATASLMALERSGSTGAWTCSPPRPGGGTAGVMGQFVSTVGATFLVERFAAFLAALASSAALAGAAPGRSSIGSPAVAARLLAPRIGRRGVKIQPTPGTGSPPMSRSSWKSQGCWP